MNSGATLYGFLTVAILRLSMLLLCVMNTKTRSNISNKELIGRDGLTHVALIASLL